MRYCRHCHQTFAGERETCPSDGAPLESLTAFESELIGAELDGRFHLERLLGRGGMGTVFLGEQLSVGRDVAVKILRSSVGLSDASFERFTREARTMSELQHPNIVRLIDFGRDEARGAVYLAMEYIRGLALADVLARGRLQPEAALEIMVQICAALSEPHERDIVHRDLKPDNISLLRLADESLQVKVLDFGIARTLENDERLTDSGVVCGTPTYMAPEQSRGVSVDPRTDLYSLGVILYEMLAGRRPFSGESGIELMLQHVREPPPALPQFDERDELHGELQTLLDDLLAKDPDDRPAGAVQLRDRLEELRQRWGFQPLRLPATDDGELDLSPWLQGRELPMKAMETNQADVRADGQQRDASDDAVATTAAPESLGGTDLYESDDVVPDDIGTDQTGTSDWPATGDEEQSRQQPSPAPAAPDNDRQTTPDEDEDSPDASGSAVDGRSAEGRIAREVEPSKRRADERQRWPRGWMAIGLAVVGGLTVLGAVVYVEPDNKTGAEDEVASDSRNVQKSRESSSSRGAGTAPGSPTDRAATRPADTRDSGSPSQGHQPDVASTAGKIASHISDGGLDPSLAIDGRGWPLVAYLRNGKPVVAQWNGEVWEQSPIDQAGRVEAGLAVGLGPNDEPRVAIRQSDANDIELATVSNDGWTLEPVDREVERFGFDSMATGPSGEMHLGFLGGDGALWYASRRDGQWMKERIVRTMDDYELSIHHVDTAVGPDGEPHICAYDNTFRAIVYARKGETGWTVESYESDGGTGRNCSITVDSQGRAVVVFTRSRSAAVQEIGIARRSSNGTWETLPTIEQHPSMTPSYDVAVNHRDEPRFVYARRLDSDTSALTTVRWNGSRWLSTEITRKLPGKLPSQPIASLAVGPDHKTHIVFTDRNGLNYLQLD